MPKNIASIIIVILGVFVALLLIRNQDSAPSTSAFFSTETTGLSQTKNSEVAVLKDGDTFDVTASIVQKTVAGKSIKMLAYNEMIPGPVITVPQNSRITIHLTNNTDIPTTLHSHGVRMDNAFDGVPGTTQPLIPIGGSFDYQLKFPDVGVFWYHPHFREDYAQALGLYGNFVVTPNDSSYWSPVNQEVPLMLSDMLLNADGSIVPFSQSSTDHTLMGRYGNMLLVNGQQNYQLEGKAGEVVRFYLTNVASARPFNFAIPGVKIKLVGGDNGKYERETFVDSVILGPSERAVIEALFDKPGQYVLQNKTPNKVYGLGTINVSSQEAAPSFQSQFNILRTNQDTKESIDPFRAFFNKISDKKLTLGVVWNGASSMGGHMMPDGTMMGGHMMGSGESIEWEDTMMNTVSDKDTVQWKITDQETGKINEDISWSFKVGDKVKVKVFNDPNSAHPMQHPIHFHGQRFLVVSINGTPNSNVVWKDTVLVGSGDTVELLIDMTNPGTWMAHCHISEHLEDGMMFSYKVTK